jgi:hypothetical protein
MSSKFDLFVKDKFNVYNKEKRINKLHDNLDSFVFLNSKQISMGLVEFINNTVFHGFDTLKVRLQARSLIEDVSHFNKNKVQFKRNIINILKYYSTYIWRDLCRFRILPSRFFLYLRK